MITAIKEYINLCKLSVDWMKRHWKFYIVLNVIVCIITCMFMFPEYVEATVEVIKERLGFTKKEEE